MIRIWIITLLLVTFSACEQKPSPSPFVFAQNIMTMDYRILVGHSLSQKQQNQIEVILEKTFEEIDSIYNKWNPNSEISKLNRLKAGQTVQLSPELFAFLTRIDNLVKLTEGRFDPTIEPLQSLWRKHLEKRTTPSIAEINVLKPAIGWTKIHFEHGLFSKEDSHTQIDLGGVAKGYAVDLLVNRINKAGYENVFVEWGGEITAMGMHPEGRPWTIYISYFEDSNPETAIAKIELKNQAIATSGNYLQTWLSDSGELYTHIYDPITLQPLKVTPKSVASASVLADDCTTADAIATALMLFESVEEAEAWAQKLKIDHPDRQFWILSREGSKR